MRDDYLWDGSGEPDPEIQRLENTLARFRHNRPAPVFPAIVQTKTLVWSIGLALRLAASAAVIAIAAVAAFMLLRPKPQPVPQSAWDVSPVQGIPKVGGEAVNVVGGTQKLTVGEVLETDAASKANITLADTGEINVEPGTRLRLLSSNRGIKKIGLERGTIHASIWAPPGEFVVDTPSAVAVDLGCVYTLHVDDSGNGLLRTTLGWVGFKLNGRESFIPAGAVCPTKRKTGPGIPYFEDATESFRSALAQLEPEAGSQEQRAAALKTVLTQARKRDAFSLWHLLSRVTESERGLVYDRLAQLVPAPQGVTREGILHADQKMLDLWWNQFDLGDVSLWRHWEKTVVRN
jgi:hypothetical protein